MSQAVIASPLGSLAVNVYEYHFDLSSQLDSAQTRDGIQWYPIKALQDDFIFSVQFNSQLSLLNFQNFILQHYQNPDITLSQQSIVRFYWPELNFDYAGIIRESTMGIKKWEWAPKRTYKMQLVRDSIFTVTGGFNSTTSWQDIYGTSTVNTNPPALPDPGGDPGDTVLTPPSSTPTGNGGRPPQPQ